MYMQFCIKDHIQQIRSQSENDDIPQEPENLRFAHFFALIIDIMDNIITYYYILLRH